MSVGNKCKRCTHLVNNHICYMGDVNPYGCSLFEEAPAMLIYEGEHGCVVRNEYADHSLIAGYEIIGVYAEGRFFSYDEYQRHLYPWVFS